MNRSKNRYSYLRGVSIQARSYLWFKTSIMHICSNLENDALNRFCEDLEKYFSDSDYSRHEKLEVKILTVCLLHDYHLKEQMQPTSISDLAQFTLLALKAISDDAIYNSDVIDTALHKYFLINCCKDPSKMVSNRINPIENEKNHLMPQNEINQNDVHTTIPTDIDTSESIKRIHQQELYILDRIKWYAHIDLSRFKLIINMLCIDALKDFSDEVKACYERGADDNHIQEWAEYLTALTQALEAKAETENSNCSTV